jgi:adenylate cyclase
MEVQFKGIDQSVILYEVAGMGGAYQISLLQENQGAVVNVDPAIPLRCFPVEDKFVSKKTVSGRLTGLTPSSADVILDHEVAIRSNLRILLDPESGEGLSEVYAKVISQEACERSSSKVKARLEFTWVPEEVKSMMKKRWLKDL